MRWHLATGGVLAALTCGLILPAQTGKQPEQKREQQPDQSPEQEPEQEPQNPFRWNYQHGQASGDRWEELLTKGVSYYQGDLEMHADSAVVFFDRDEYSRSIQWGRSKKLPRRGTSPPDTRRRLTDKVMHERLTSLLRSMGQTPGPPTPEGRQALRLFRSLYMEGNVTIRHKGVEVVRCSRLYLSTVDDRVIFEGVTMRLTTLAKDGSDRVMIVRAPKLIRQGKRTSGRNVSLTSCTAGKPHFEVFTTEFEVIERPDDFEVRTKDNALAFSGVKTLPLPNVSFFSSDQNQLPIQGFSMGYDQTEKLVARLDLGGSMNNVGGAVHNFLTGRDASEFRGDWHVGLGYNYERGAPTEAGLTYKADGLYRGETLGFYLHDNGENIRQITRDLDGALIDNTDRAMIHTENRFHLGSNTYLDLSLFDASDAAVWSEFFRRRYMRDETPETSAWLLHDDDNMLVTVEGRWNVADFSYGDDRALATSFNEKLPVATLDWFSEKLMDLPGDGELLLTTSTNVGQQRSNFDNTVAVTTNDRTFRVDQEVELAAPYYFGDFALRPFATAGFTHYDRTVPGGSRERFRFAAGSVLSTRVARTFHTHDAKDREVRIQHVINPTISVSHQFKVDRDPGYFYQHDQIDALTEKAVIRFGLVNRLKHIRKYDEDELKAAKQQKDSKQRKGVTQQQDDKVQTHTQMRQVLWADVGQNVLPISGRDNMGHHIGFLDYEVVLRPLQEWVPIPNLVVIVQGEHDWIETESRTFNAAVTFGRVLGVNWAAEYFKDSTTKGAIGYGANTDLFGRWQLAGQGQYDLERNENLNYVFTLQRQDHDWTITAGFEFDSVTDDVSFNITFEPSFGGLFKPKRRSEYGGRVLQPGARTYY